MKKLIMVVSTCISAFAFTQVNYQAVSEPTHSHSALISEEDLFLKGEVADINSDSNININTLAPTASLSASQDEKEKERVELRKEEDSSYRNIPA